MKKLIIVFVFAIIANNSFAQTGTDSLLRYTLNLETMSQREQANKEYLEQKESSGFGTIRIIPEASYKHISAEMSFPMYSGGYPFSVPVIPVHFWGVKTDYLLRS